MEKLYDLFRTRLGFSVRPKWKSMQILSLKSKSHCSRPRKAHKANDPLTHPHTFYQQIRQAIWTLIFGTIRTYRIPLAECHKFISISENHSAYSSKRGILMGLMAIIHIFAYILTLSRERYMQFLLLFVTERRDS